MSKRGRHTRRWHIRRIRDEFGREPETIIREMFNTGEPLTVMAGALGISYGEMHEWVHNLGLERKPIPRCSRRLTWERLLDEHNFDPVRLICSDRACGMSYAELREKYDISQGFVADCLHTGAPWLIGTHDAPVTVRPPELSDEERARRAEICREHNRQMAEDGVGWAADHAQICRSR